MEKVELDVVIERLDNIIKQNAKEHKEIIEQTTKTNGSVAKIQKWKERATGIFIAVNIFVVPVVVAVLIKAVIELIGSF